MQAVRGETRFVQRVRYCHGARPVAGTIVVRVNALVGTTQPERYRWLRETFEPVEHIAYAHLVFHVTPEDLRRIGVDDGAARR